jgi:hypothetical protein
MATSWLHRLLKKSRPPSRSGRKQFGQSRFVPNLEALGDRIVPSTFHVTTLADGVAGSLRDAVAQANAHAGADTIVFESGLTGTIALTGGELDITDDLTINGLGADRLNVSGNNTSRVFKVESGEAVKISGLTIAGGHPDSGSGGGIDNFGTLTVSDSVFSSNSVSVFVFSSDSISFPDGGGLANESGGTATLRGSTFIGNSASHFGGGLSNSGTLTVSDSTFTGNSASFGGGLANEVRGTATVSGSTFTNNTARFGGGISNRGTVTVTDSTFTGNTATVHGGGIDNFGTATVSDSTFTENTAGSGNGGLNNEPGGVLTQSDNQFINDLPPDVFP